MRPKNNFFQYLLFFLFVSAALFSCSRFEKAKEIFTNPTAREKYAGFFPDSSEEYEAWRSEYENALFDSIEISLPYTERGKFSAETIAAHSYSFELVPGERLQVVTETDSTESLLFLDLFLQKHDSVAEFDLLKQADFENNSLTYEAKKPGTYKLILQPEISAETPFRLKIWKEPVYEFPVVASANARVQSFWGARRDGGRRSHEGIDIFAPRGTPVIAATEGRITFTGEKGLGGKQVWLRDRDRRNSLYYAHLDSIIISSGRNVERGDTLGLIGNTGNARTTPPHLHFGIYSGYSGAKNPLPFVEETEKPEFAEEIPLPESHFRITTGRANLRSGPSLKAEVLQQAENQDTLLFLGRSGDWLHTEFQDRNYFIHSSLTAPPEAL